MMNASLRRLACSATAILLCGAAPSALALDVDFSGSAGFIDSSTVTVDGVVLTGYSSDTYHSGYTPSKLYQRNETGDRGMGVCSEGAAACASGGGDVNELDNDGTWEIIALTLPAGYDWVSVMLSSLDQNGGAAVPQDVIPERGKLYAAGNPTDFSTWTLIADLEGSEVDPEQTFAIPALFASAPYLVFEPVNTIDDPSEEIFRNNDFLVWVATITERQECPGTGTPGYWKNHPEAWPVQSITIGGVTYSKDQAIAIMWSKNAGDKTWTMFNALVSAKLNSFIGCNCSPIGDTIAAADAWMAKYGPVGSNVRGDSAAWYIGEPLYFALDNFNNGGLYAYGCPHRD
jgi:hypothetical protein